MEVMIYGAKAIALGVCVAVRKLYPDVPVRGFLVTSRADNPKELAGLPVWQVSDFAQEKTKQAGIDTGRQQQQIHILIGTPEDMHPQIEEMLQRYGFFHYTCMDSARESRLMERYYAKTQQFPSLHTLRGGRRKADLHVFAAKFYKDRPLKYKGPFPAWIHFLQVGAALTGMRIAGLADNTGYEISEKNVNYCELTALYWLWKNRLPVLEAGVCDSPAYFGLFHYRRTLDISDEDLYRLGSGEVDAVLQFPTVHAPDISEHHSRYLKEADWQAMCRALQQLHPEYARALPEIFAQPYFYNYNLIIAKREVLADYCSWLFPVLERTEELSCPKGNERADRYIGYLGENLMTLYFLYHKEDLKIFHTGRRMLT